MNTEVESEVVREITIYMQDNKPFFYHITQDRTLMERLVKSEFLINRILHSNQTLEEYTEKSIKWFNLHVNNIRECWMIFAITYHSGEFICNICSSKEEAEKWLSEELKKYPELSRLTDFIIAQSNDEHFLTLEQVEDFEFFARASTLDYR